MIEVAFMEGEFYQISFQLAKLLQRQNNALDRAHDCDYSNNTWLAGLALDDYHKTGGSCESLRERGREVAQHLPEDVREGICRQAKRDAEIDAFCSRWTSL